VNLGNASKLHRLPAIGVIAALAVGASIGLSTADAVLVLDAGFVTPGLALVAGLTTALFLLRSSKRGPTFTGVAAGVVTSASLVPGIAKTVAATGLWDWGSLPIISFGATAIALWAVGATLRDHDRATFSAAWIATAPAVVAVAFSLSGVVDRNTAHVAAVRLAAWVFAAGSLTIALVLANAHGVTAQGHGSRRLLPPLVILLVANATPLAISLWLSSVESRGILDRVIQITLALNMFTLVLGLRRLKLLGPYVLLTASAGGATTALFLVQLGMSREHDAPASFLAIWVILAMLFVTSAVARRRAAANPPKADQLPKVTPETFRGVAFPVAPGSGGALAVGPIPDVPPGEAPRVDAALRAGENVVTTGDLVTARRQAASVAAGWGSTDSLVVWVSGETQDRLDTGLARGVEAILHAGGARGPVYATVGAALLAHRYFRAFPGPVLVVVDGWSGAAAERLSPREWHGAASLLLIGGEWPGAHVVAVGGEPSPAHPVALPVPAGPTLEAAILAGAPGISRRALALLVDDEDSEAAIRGHLATGVMREFASGERVCVSEDLASRHLEAWSDGGDLARRALPLLLRVAQHLPEFHGFYDPRHPTLDLAEAGIEFWGRGCRALEGDDRESAIQAMHRVVEALVSAADNIRAFRVADDVAECARSAPGSLTYATRLRAIVDAACVRPVSSLPPALVAETDDLVDQCRAKLGENNATTLDSELPWSVRRWADVPRAMVIERISSVAQRFARLHGADSPRAMEAEWWVLGIRGLTNDHISDVEAWVERAQHLDATLPRPCVEICEGYASLSVTLDHLGRHDEARDCVERGLAVVTEDYGHLHPVRASLLLRQAGMGGINEAPAESLVRMIDIHPLLELTQPWSAMAISAPMRWAGFYASAKRWAEARALLESVGERMAQACPPGSPLRDGYLKSMRALDKEAARRSR
jgi:hypothetical protein